jgi:hypothetical protein
MVPIDSIHSYRFIYYNILGIDLGCPVVLVQKWDWSPRNPNGNWWSTIRWCSQPRCSMFLQVPRVAKSSNRWGRTTRNFPPRRPSHCVQWRDLFVKWMCLVDGSNRASSDAYGTSGDLTWWKMDEPGQFIDYHRLSTYYKQIQMR